MKNTLQLAHIQKLESERSMFDFYDSEDKLLLTQFPRFARAPEFAATPTSDSHLIEFFRVGA